MGAFSSASSKYKCKGLFQTASGLSSSSGASETTQQQSTSPSSRLRLVELAPSTPAAAAALQLDSHAVGRAIHRIATGAVVVVRLRGDLGELNTRLQAEGQASLLAQRLEKGVGVPPPTPEYYPNLFALVLLLSSCRFS